MNSLPPHCHADAGSAFVSVIVISFWENRTLEACLAALTGQTAPPDEIIVVEDVSSRRSRKICERWKVRHAVLPPPPSGDYGRRAACRRLGAELARGEVLVFLDGDTLPAPTVLERIAETWRKSVAGTRKSVSLLIPSVDVSPLYIAGRGAQAWEKILSFSAGKTDSRPGMGSFLWRPYGNHWFASRSQTAERARPCRNRRHMRWQEVKSRFWVMGSKDLAQVNGWDSDFVGYGEEDIELAYRLHRTCKTRFCVLHAPDVVAAHVLHQIDFSRRDREWARNGALLIAKHPELKRERRTFFRSLGLETLLMREMSRLDSRSA